MEGRSILLKYMNITSFIASSFKEDFSTHYWQSDLWEKAKQQSGCRTFRFEVGGASTLVIERKPHFLKFWKKTMWEIPRGPVGNIKDMPALLDHVFAEAFRCGISWVRVYPPFGNDFFWNLFPESFWEEKQTATAPEIFPLHTLMLDLSLSDEEILMQMKPKGRYNIKVAEKNGVVVKEEKDIKNFWKLMQETSKRDGFTSCKKHTYEDLLKAFGENAILLSAYSPENEILASKIFTVADGMAVYNYGASSSQNRKFMAPYLLQWHGMQWAKTRGATVYDFLGISPDDEDTHKLSSVADFKLKFGGQRAVCDEGIDFFL